MNTQRYLGFAAQIAAASNMSFCEIWNPAASGKTAKVTKIEINSKDTGMSFFRHTSQQGASGTIGVHGNKHLGGAAPGIIMYGEDIVTTVAGTKFYTVTTVADVVKILDFEKSPIVIDPGASFIVACDVVNKALTRVSFEWHEIDNKY